MLTSQLKQCCKLVLQQDLFPGYRCHVAACSLSNVVINRPLCRCGKYRTLILDPVRSFMCFQRWRVTIAGEADLGHREYESAMP